MSPAYADNLGRGRDVSERVMPGLEAALAARYDAWLPGFSEWQIGTVYGGVYGRDGADLKTRQIATVAALAVLGDAVRPQMKIHVKAALDLGISPREICEIVMQMALYGGFPAAINALNATLEVFEAEGLEP
ncbi:carboxymuconolactone decarboxylase family protein [Thalassococcus sp. CAU 1522]|uniref:Carboxymuconolactone decarboxylase family protein n=1 Tax=Thalassococcus arenae TaxID=2851652 RepID=A0ABS6N9C8_9RHOB|nr:carboxymuconolactone decarboxylase family protein [Thalassococcus arenae]MBV2360573.1 carboxymuconolactone decarboxylase family protein [Thalassococcus arenae]